MRIMPPMPHLAQRDVELVVRADRANPRRVVVAFLLDRDQRALRYDWDRNHVRALIEELGGRVEEDAVLLDNVEESVLRKTRAVRDREVEGWREVLDLVGDAVLVTIRHRPDAGLAGSDEDHDALRADRHVARVRNDGIEIDLEARRQVDPLQRLADRDGLRTALLDICEIGNAGGLELAQLLQIRLCGCGPRHGDRKDGSHASGVKRSHFLVLPFFVNSA
jgi:hypothetical protein